jgi:hypothetical protein
MLTLFLFATTLMLVLAGGMALQNRRPAHRQSCRLVKFCVRPGLTRAADARIASRAATRRE